MTSDVEATITLFITELQRAKRLLWEDARYEAHDPLIRAGMEGMIDGYRHAITMARQIIEDYNSSTADGRKTDHEDSPTTTH